MNAATAMRLLRGLDVPVVSTSDAAALFGQSPRSASKTMERLAASELVQPVRRGLWVVAPQVDPYLVAGHMAAPYPAYVSLWSALYLRGVIAQIPASIFVATLGRTRRARTVQGTYSMHHIAPELFGGFEVRAPSGVRLATVEKAVFDLAYFSSTRSRLFSGAPEMELPRGFRWSAVSGWLARVHAPVVAARVRSRLEALRRHMGTLLQRGLKVPPSSRQGPDQKRTQPG